MPAHSPDLEGNQYGEWTVLSRAYRNKHRKWCWLCRCSCGTLSVVKGNSLTTGTSKRCRKCCTRDVLSPRGSLLVSWGEHTLPFKEWAEITGHPMQRMYHRLRNGWTLTECLTVGTDPVILSLLGLDDTCQAEEAGQQPTENT